METKFSELVVVQKVVNNKVLEKAKYQPTPVDFALAGQVEMFEFINSIGTWKWWKHNHKVDKEKVLDELADVMAFYLAFAINFWDEDTLLYLDDAIQDFIQEISSFSSQVIMRNIASSINNGTPAQSMTLMIAEAVVLAAKELNVGWEEIEEAYIKKSEINIQRQEQNY